MTEEEGEGGEEVVGEEGEGDDGEVGEVEREVGDVSDGGKEGG